MKRFILPFVAACLLLVGSATSMGSRSVAATKTSGFNALAQHDRAHKQSPSPGPWPSPSPSPSPSPTPTTAPSPTPSGGGNVNGYWLYGANMPWLNWYSDFGGSSGDVASNTAEVDVKLAAAHNAGMHEIRWWVFEGGSPQIQRDANGVPTGLAPGVYMDIDAALSEAAKYDISYDFVLFGSTNDDSVTHQWWEDSIKRGALVSVLTPLFRHYAGNPRIHTWEIVNEPDWQIRNGQTTQAGATATVNALADAVHQNTTSGQLVTVGEAQLQDMTSWVGAHLDYHSPHYYDNFGTGSNDPFVNNASSPDGKPVVVGEFQASTGLTPATQQRWQSLYQNGYAGAWPWSLSPEHTADKISIDLAAALNFAIGRSDLGPSAGVIPPPPISGPSPSPSPSPSPVTSSAVYDWEDGSLQGWQAAWGSITVANSTAHAFTGTHSLAINVPGGAAAWPAVDNQTGPFPGLAGGKTITYAVWSPSASAVSVTPFVYDQSWWANFGTGINLAQGWNLVTFTVPTSVITFNSVGLQINNGTGWSGTLYLDTVGWS